MTIEIKSRYDERTLRTVDADTLAGANLYGANLRGADWREECAGGIHFFITRAEAEAY